MTTKLYTVDNAGKQVPFRTDVFGTLDASSVIDNEEDEDVKRRINEAFTGLRDVSIECEVTLPPELCAELRKRHATLDAIRAAMFKLRKSCRNCRWMVVERDHHKKRPYLTHNYCKYNRNAEVFTPFDLYAVYCRHFRLKCKSKQ